MKTTNGLLSIALVFLTSCSAAEVYDKSTSLRYAQCRKFVDADEKAHCFATADLSYEQYKKLAEQ